MTEKIKLVQGDTRPQLLFALTDEVTGTIIDLTTAASALMKFRTAGSTVIKASIPCIKLMGRQLEDGTIDYSAPYNVTGAGGRLYMDWPVGTLDEAGEFEGEIEITFSDATVHTIYDLIKFKVREQF